LLTRGARQAGWLADLKTIWLFCSFVAWEKIVSTYQKGLAEANLLRFTNPQPLQPVNI
jgi:hypothetical protein